MRLTRTISTLCLTMLMAGLSAFCAETAVLRNGYTVRVESHQSLGSGTRLFLDSAGKSFVDVPTAEIERYEPAPDLSPAPPQQQPSAAAQTASSLDFDEAIDIAGRRNNIDPDLLRCVIHAESDFNARAVSSKGARGLMQLMPATARHLGVEDSFDPMQNIEAGARHLSNLLDRYHNDLIKALAAYNAGTDPVEQYRGVPPYRETRAYVARIIREFNRLKRAPKLAARNARKASAQTVLLSESTADDHSGQ